MHDAYLIIQQWLFVSIDWQNLNKLAKRQHLKLLTPNEVGSQLHMMR